MVVNPLLGMPQGAEWIVILAIVILVFGAAKLPALARSSGQALRIFKSETRGLMDDDDDKDKDKDDVTASASPEPPVTRELPPTERAAGPTSEVDAPEARTDRHPG